MKEHPDINDTLRSEGPDAVRARHDQASRCARERDQSDDQPGHVRLEDFVAYMPMHNYIFTPTREPWPASSVNARIPPAQTPNGKPILASAWLDANAPVEQMTWAPGEPMLIKDRLISEGGWIARSGCTVLNIYRPPTSVPRKGDVMPWLNHVYRVYPAEADHIIRWFAHRVQRPQEKINHALVLGGLQGIGKDTLIEPVKRGVGPWNVAEVSPLNLLAASTAS